MFEIIVIADLDAQQASEAIAAAHRDLVALEAHQLRLAAHWLDLHAPHHHRDHRDTPPAATTGTGRVLPGTERMITSGADGTAMVAEFAAAEFAALQDIHPAAGAALLRKVANLRERHPLLWARVHAGQVRAWKALETARLVGRCDAGQPALSQESARCVDAQTHTWIDTLPWTSYLALVEKMIIAADPRRAETIREIAATEQFVTTSQSSEHGLKTLIAQANAGDVIYLTAVIDRLAAILTLRGDTRPLGPRRATALGILAHPAHALALLSIGLTPHQDHDPATSDPTTSDPGPSEDTGPPEPAETPAPPDPSDLPDVPEPSTVPSYLDLPPDLLTQLRSLLGQVDLERLLPRATLYVHISHDTFTGPLGNPSNPDHPGRLAPTVADVEGIGPITLPQAREWLGHHRVTLVPVLDPAATTAVSGYTFTPGLREALHAAVPRDVFPYAVNTGRHKDIDHPTPYRPPRGNPGDPLRSPLDNPPGPPGQTGLHNAAPMTRHHHRLKTHAAWNLTQLAPSTYLWRSPHHHHWIVDPTGTYRIPRTAGEWIHQAHARRTASDHAAA